MGVVCKRLVATNCVTIGEHLISIRGVIDTKLRATLVNKLPPILVLNKTPSGNNWDDKKLTFSAKKNKLPETENDIMKIK